jgi:hypothetical protein
MENDLYKYAVSLFVAFLILISSPAYANTRLIILADMGNEPDEEQQMTHMLMCSNEFEVEGLIAVTGTWLRETPLPELFLKLIDGYEQVVDNLKVHADGWPEPDFLRSITKAGNTGYGTAVVKEGNESPGSKLIIEAVTAPDPRPVWVVVNAGSNTLAQALVDYRASHTEAEVDAFVAKLRIYENGAQDNAGAWICANFPDIYWIRSKTQTYCYGGPGWADRTDIGPYVWQPYENTELGQNFWALKHIKAEHGPLGAMWPLRMFPDGALRNLEGGGTIPWMGLVNKGLFDIEHPHWGGWSGRFGREKEKNIWSGYAHVKDEEANSAPFYVYNEKPDHWINPETGEEYNSNSAAIWRWRRAMYNDFQCRMDWCLGQYAEANHHPSANINGDSGDTIIRLDAKPGETVSLDASHSTDPDGDALQYSWYMYPEAGTYKGNVEIGHAEGSEPLKASVVIPGDAGGTQIHVILEIKDLSPIASLYDYRRVVIDVK